MTKWADYLISEVQYNDSSTCILKVKQHVDNGDSVGLSNIVPKSIVVTNIRNEQKKYCTIRKNSDGKWIRGDNIIAYEKEKERYEEEFGRLAKEHKAIRCLKSLPGIKNINAVKILAYVVDPRRFPTSNHFWSYCGLIKLDRVSGGRSYGKKNSRYCRILKEVFKTAALASVGERTNNPMQDYNQYLINERHLPDYQARHAVARRIATLAWGVLKSETLYNPNRRVQCKKAT